MSPSQTSLSLTDKRIVVTRPQGQAAPLIHTLQTLGAQAIAFPLLEIQPPARQTALKNAVKMLAQTDIAIFVSRNAVEYAAKVLPTGDDWPESLRVLAVGPGTREALLATGCLFVSVPAVGHFDTEGLLALLEGEDLAGKQIQIYRGDHGRPLLGEQLTERGAHIQYVTCYRRIKVDKLAEKISRLFATSSPDAIVLTSSEAAEHLYDSAPLALRQKLLAVPIITSHPRISQMVAEKGGHAVTAAGGQDIDILGALDAHLNRAGQSPLRQRLSNGLMLWLSPIWVLFTLLLLAFLWQWAQTQRQYNDLRVDVGTQLAEADGRYHASKENMDQLARERDDLRGRMALLENKINDAQSQQDALSSLYQELAQHRDNLLLAEVEQLLLTANEQIVLSGQAKRALLALELAQTRLSTVHLTRFVPLKAALAQDIDALKRVPDIETTLLAQQIDQVMVNIDALPQHIRKPETISPAMAEKPVQGTGYQRVMAEIWRDLKSLVRIKRIEANDAPLLPPEQAFFVRENLKMRLLSARLALFAHDGTSFREDLMSAEALVYRYFDRQSEDTQRSLEQIHQLRIINITPTLPAQLYSWAALQRLLITPGRSY